MTKALIGSTILRLFASETGILPSLSSKGGKISTALTFPEIERHPHRPVAEGICGCRGVGRGSRACLAHRAARCERQLDVRDQCGNAGELGIEIDPVFCRIDGPFGRNFANMKADQSDRITRPEVIGTMRPPRPVHRQAPRKEQTSKPARAAQCSSSNEPFRQPFPALEKTCQPDPWSLLAGGSQLSGRRPKNQTKRHTISGRAANAIMPRLP